MSSLRHSNDPSFDSDQLDPSDSDAQSLLHLKTGKGSGRPGRPRGKGRPKRSSKMLSKKQSQDSQEWQQKVYVRERAPPSKQQSSIEGYIKIIDYLKKIDYDEASLQNKMNPYNALTATCFWYAISAEYFSFDFNSKKGSHDASMEILEKIQKLPLLLANRTMKTIYNPSLVEFQNEQLNHLGIQMSEKMNNLIPAPLAYRPEFIERKIPISSVAQDIEFISSTRSILYNYIAKKIKNSDKWTGLLASYSQQIQGIPEKQFKKPNMISLPEQEEPCKQENLFELLRQQAKKKMQNRDKNKALKASKTQKQSQIFHEDSLKQEQQEMRDENQVDRENQAEEGSKQAEEIYQQGEEKNELMIDQDEDKKKENQQEIKSKEEKQQEKEKQNEEEANPQKMEVQVQQINEDEQKLNQQNFPAEQGSQKMEQANKIKQEEQVKEENNEQRVFTKKYSQQDLILDSIMHLPLDKVISILQSNLPTVELPSIHESFMPIPTKDPLEFVFQLHPEEQRYLDYMKEHRKKKYREKVAKSEVTFEEQERDCQFQDAKCQICTDGDYTDDNLIVFCSLCNISLHQRCVGLAKVPAQSWVCDVCLAFGPAGINLPCPLCNVKGGAMKRTSIHIDTNIFKQINPGYYEYSKKCPYNKQKEEYVPKQKIQGQQQPIGQPIVKVVREKGQRQQQCYYDYFVKSTYPSDTPVCHYVWVHYVCSIWVPQCYFQEKNGVISVKGIENIDNRRFKSQCFACKKNKCGAAVKCEDPECNKYYHPECARKKKVYMEQLNLQKLKYLIFCQEHEPLKLTRQIEYKKKKNREEIIKFARMIEKYIETYRIAQFPFKLMKSAIPHNFIDTSHKSDRDDNKDRKLLAAKSDELFLKDLISNLSKAKMMTVHLEKIDNGYKITNVETPSKREIRKCLNRYDQFWNSIKNGDSVEENFRRYERIMMENQKLKEKLELFLNGTLPLRSKNQDKKEKKTGRRRGKQAVQVQTLIEQEGGIFCVCKKPYRGESDMFECQVCGQWYHFRCLGFIGTEDDAQKMEFKCMKCMKFQDKDKKQERLNKYAQLFSPDSILYLYRPPTPDLLSEEEVEQKNYQEIMAEVKKSIQAMNSPKKQKKQEGQGKMKEEIVELKQFEKEMKQKKSIQKNAADQVVEIKQKQQIKKEKNIQQIANISQEKKSELPEQQQPEKQKIVEEVLVEKESKEENQLKNIEINNQIPQKEMKKQETKKKKDGEEMKQQKIHQSELEKPNDDDVNL